MKPASSRGRVVLVSVAVLAALVVLFALQNLGEVTVRFLAFEFDASVALITFVPFLTGLLVGWAGVTLRRRSAARPAGPKAGAAPTGGRRPPSDTPKTNRDIS